MARLGLRTAQKPESMDVCFITKGARVQFLDARSNMPAGTVVDVEGTAVGTHHGIGAFTIGQRRGTGVAAGERQYVVDIDPSTATVTIGPRGHLLRDEITLRGVTFVGASPGAGLLYAQVRAHGEPAAAQLVGRVVRFVDPQPRVAPGQVVALYDGDTLVGGGIAE